MVSSLTPVHQRYNPDVAPRVGVMPRPAWHFLMETSALIDGSLDYEETLTNILRFVVPRIADAAILTTSANERHVFALHRDPVKQPLLEQLAAPLTASRLGSQDEAEIPAMLDAVTTMTLPLVARGRSLGTLRLFTTHDSERRYTSRDITVGRQLGDRAAIALDNAFRFRASTQLAQAREEMMAVVSHDLKNPLATIQMAVRFLLEDLSPIDAGQQLGRTQLRVIHRSAERMYRMVHDLLDVSALEVGRLPIARAGIAADLLIGDAVELLQPLAATRRLALVTSTDPELPAVVADRERILQVFSNLGGNAIKFTPEGGLIEISASARDDGVEFSVRDTGPGIAAAALPHIFDRFWQGTATGRSSIGLGLAIVRGIVQAHGGEIHVESRPGHGSLFRFTLPLARS